MINYYFEDGISALHVVPYVCGSRDDGHNWQVQWHKVYNGFLWKDSQNKKSKFLCIELPFAPVLEHQSWRLLEYQSLEVHLYHELPIFLSNNFLVLWRSKRSQIDIDGPLVTGTPVGSRAEHRLAVWWGLLSKQTNGQTDAINQCCVYIPTRTFLQDSPTHKYWILIGIIQIYNFILFFAKFILRKSILIQQKLYSKLLLYMFTKYWPSIYLWHGALCEIQQIKHVWSHSNCKARHSITQFRAKI